MAIDAIISLASLFGKPLVDTVKGWIHRKDSPEKTIASLAQTNPTALVDYVKAQAEFVKARVLQFNQDMPDNITPENTPVWVVSLRELLEIYRGAIRPGVITLAAIHIGYITIHDGVSGLAQIPEWIRYQYEVAINSWFGDRWK